MSEFLEKVKKTRDYLDYVEEHYLNVQQAWLEVQEKCKDMRIVSGDYYFTLLDKEIEEHDLSKLSVDEFVQYREAFFKTETELRICLTHAWECHKKYNLHHWENWATKSFSDHNEWEVHCAHMVIDWVAMGYKFGDNAKTFYEKNKDEILLPEYAIAFMYEIFNRVYKSI